jgi:hypothetical protein
VEYITLPGWQTDIADVRDYEKLPHNAKKYIEMIEEKVQVPGTYVGQPICFLLAQNPASLHFRPFSLMQSMNITASTHWHTKFFVNMAVQIDVYPEPFSVE